MKKLNLLKIACISLISLSLFSCEEEEINTDVCSENFKYVEGESFISDRIAEIDAAEELQVKQVDQWVMGEEAYYVFRNKNTARGIDQRAIYTCTNDLYRDVTEDEWQVFKDSDVFRSALHVDVIYQR